MFKKPLENSLLILISISLALGLSELVVRSLKLAPEIVYVEKWRVRLSENRKIGYEPIPNLNSAGKSAQYYSYIGRSNNMGYRDYDHPLEKPTGSQRIVVLGDSVTAGLWIKGDDKIFTSVMERRLKQAGENIDVMNFGVSGYNTSQEVETLETYGLQFNPNIVILAYCLNDRSQDDGNIYGILLAEAQKSKNTGHVDTASINSLERHSALLRFMRYNVLGVQSGSSRQQEKRKTIDQFYVDTVEESFENLSQLSSAHNFKVLVAIFPNFGEKDEGLKNDYAFQVEHNAIAQLSKQHGFDTIDLLAPFRTCKQKISPRSTISFDRYHPNVIGNKCAGEALAEKVSGMLHTQ